MITNYISKYINDKLGEIASIGDSDCRVILSGLPKWLLKNIYKELCSKPWALKSGQDVGVYFLDEDFSDPTTAELHAECTPSYFVGIRNNKNYPVCIALSPGKSVTSIDTTVREIGIANNTNNFNDWFSSDLIQHVIEAHISSLKLSLDVDILRDAIKSRLKEVWNEEVHNIYGDMKWEFLEKILDSKSLKLPSRVNGSGSSNLEASRLAASLALPYNTNDSCFSDLIALRADIKKFFRENTFSEIKAQLVHEIIELKRHNKDVAKESVAMYFGKLEELEIEDSDQYFHSSYSDYRSTGIHSENDVDEWWDVLDADIWKKVVTNYQESELIYCKTLFSGSGKLGYFQSSPNFEYKISNDKIKKVALYRSVDGGRKKEDLVTELNIAKHSTKIELVDPNPPDHKNQINYWVKEFTDEELVRSSNKSSVVVLNKLHSKLVIRYDDDKKQDAKVFKFSKKDNKFSCDLKLKSQGEYDIKFYSAESADMPKIANGIKVDSEHGNLDVLLNEVNPNYHTSLISIDEDCSYELEMIPGSNSYSLVLQANDSPVSYSSEYDKLICQHFVTSKGHVQPKNDFLTQLEACYAENIDHSYRPIHMTYDFINKCINDGKIPCEELEDKWKQFPQDLPDYWENLIGRFDLPISFVDSRQNLLSKIYKLHNPHTVNSEFSFKRIRFSEYFDDIKDLTKKYLEQYLKLLEDSPDIAKLCDVVGIGEDKDDQECPDIILLSPAHPIRLAWHILTHEQLQVCLDKSSKCPGVGFINSSSIPKSFDLNFRNRHWEKDRDEFSRYYSVENSNDYWGVFLPINATENSKNLFSKKFGVEITGIDPGLSRRHVLSAMQDVAKVVSPATDLDISITKSEVKSDAVFEGISDWCKESLIEEDGPSTFTGNVTVLDNRLKTPESANISYLSEVCNSKVEWYRPDGNGKKEFDLSLTPDLDGKKRKEGKSEHLNSHIDTNCLVRWDLRYERDRPKSGSNRGLNNLQETQIFDYEASSGALSRSFEIELLKCVESFERNSEDNQDDTNTLVFPSDPEGIESSIDKSSYLAISSANVDPALFFNLNDLYIWNLDLPLLSQVGRNSDGYYLLAKAKKVALDHFSTAYEKLCGQTPTNEDVKECIKDLSDRGIPTIKAISQGGRTAFGEVGLHACLKSLQPIENKGSTSGPKSIFPLMIGDFVNLIIPVDLFEKWLGQFRKSLKISNENRPDLLCLSVYFVSSSDSVPKPIAKKCKITPIEVKTRDGSYTKNERKSAIKQADSLCEYLKKFQKIAGDNSIWKSSFKGFIESFLSYGFRIAAKGSGVDVVTLHEKYDATISSLACDNLEIEISDKGKAFIVSELSGSHFDFDNTFINIGKSHAKDLLIDGAMNIQNDLHAKVRDWGLFPNVSPGTRRKVASVPLVQSAGSMSGSVSSSVQCRPSEFDQFFSDNNVLFADLHVTQTGLDKSIFDATEIIRDLFVKYRFHDYANQGKGQAAKLLKPIRFFYNGGFIDLEMSLYRPETKKGDPRFWIKDGKKYIKAGSNYVLFFNDSQLHVVNSLSYSDFESSGHISLFNKPSSVELDQSEISEFKFPVGHFVDGDKDEEAMFCPGNTDLNQLNVGIVGDLGTGKTQLIKSLIYRMVSHPELNRGKAPNLLIFDYKNDYTDDDFVSRTNANVIDPSELPLSLFDLRDFDTDQVRQNRLHKVGFFRDALEKIYSNIGPKQKELIKVAVMAAYDQAEAAGDPFPLLSDVLREYKFASNDKTDSVTSVLSDLVDHQLFTNEHQKVLPFKDFLNGVVVINLKPIGQDDSLKAMLVTIFLNLFYDHMQKIEKREFIGSNPSLRFVDSILLVDEADNIMKHEFGVLRNILKEGREYGVGVWLASQYLSHFKTKNENYCEPLLTWFIHKVPNLKAKDLSLVGMSNSPQEKADRVTTLDVFGCLYKSLNVPGHFIRGIPFFEISDSG